MGGERATSRPTPAPPSSLTATLANAAALVLGAVRLVVYAALLLPGFLQVGFWEGAGTRAKKKTIRAAPPRARRSPPPASPPSI